MKHWVLCVALLVCAAALDAAPAVEKQNKHYVFAHYMVCFATYGQSVEGYKHDIQDAQAAGIDGWALNCGSWFNEPQYPARVKMIFQAAQELDTGFKLFFSVDHSNADYVKDMVRTYGHHPNHFTWNGRPVLSTFAHEGDWWKPDVLDPLMAEGFDVCFVPHFIARKPDGSVYPAEDTSPLRVHVKKWSKTVDGLFQFGAAGTPDVLAKSNAAYTAALHEQGKISMASYSPTYWGSVQKSRRYFETDGGEGTELQWQSIIKSQPEWVEIVTWNDWGESTYISAVGDPVKYFSSYENGVQHHTHIGYYELSKYYIQWFKTGKAPPIKKDAIFYFYRTHRKDAVSADDKPVQQFVGDVQDVLYLTTMLTGPAELVVTSGDRTSTFKVKKGINHVRVTFNAGAQHFEVHRKGKCVISTDGEPILDKIQFYNFFPTTGFAYAK